MKISLKKKINIYGIGSISTLFILLMIEVLLAQILTDTLIGNISDNLMLLIIILLLFLLTIIISIITGFFVTGTIRRKSVVKASILSFLCLLLLLFTISNISLFISHRNVYSKIHGFQILWIFPQVLISFGIYILRDIFNLFIFEIVLYYCLFIIFLEPFYEVKIN